MERDWNDFKALYSNMPGARDAFEKACETLFRKLHSDRNVKQVSVKRGDGGIDIFVGELGIEPVIVFQCKFFLDQMNEAQYKQIRNSFATAANSKDYDIEKWVLCIPRILSKNESIWWLKWKKKQETSHSASSQFISLMDGNELIDLMKTQGVYDQIFQIEELNLAKDTNRKVTQLVESFERYRSTLPTISWSTYIGKQKWKNTPLIIGNDIFVGSAGSEWNKADTNDGVYCLDAATGRIKWFYPTESDVNELSIYDGNIVGGCDSGLVFCISARTGHEKWTRFLNSGVVSKVFKDVIYDYENFIVITYDGRVIFLQTANGKISETICLEEDVMGNALFVSNSFRTELIIPTVDGKIIQLSSYSGSYSASSRISVRYPDEYSQNNGSSLARLYSTPMMRGGRILTGFVRQSYYDYPAIVCIDSNDGHPIWYASDPLALGDGFGNIRSNLIAFRDEILFVHPYSNEIGGLDEETGKLNWLTKVGQPMFQQWSSPLVHNNNIYIARYDGYLYKINGETKEREWGMYLGENSDAGVVFDKNQPISNENERVAWELFKGFPLLATPVVHKNNLVIGSDEGYLYYIRDI